MSDAPAPVSTEPEQPTWTPLGSAPCEIFDVASEVPLWAAYNFPSRTRVDVTLGLAEEVGEVCRAVLKADQGIRGTREEWMRELEKELGDVFIKLVDVAAIHGIDIEDAVVKRWAEIRRRDWQVNKIGHGIGNADV